MTKEELACYRMDELKNRLNGFPLGIMLVGPTGAGKSSTINALLQNSEAAVGYGTDPKTKKTKAYKFNNYIKIWDTPGLGDSPDEDAEHVKKINSLLHRTYKKDEVACGKSIDLVLVIIDGSGRDIGTVLNIVRQHIIPNINRNNILFAVNQADMAMKGRHFNQDAAVPDATLQEFLDRQAEAFRQRILESTGLETRTPVVFSAEYSFNMHGLLDSIIDNDEWVLRKGYDIKEPIDPTIINTEEQMIEYIKTNVIPEDKYINIFDNLSDINKSFLIRMYRFYKDHPETTISRYNNFINMCRNSSFRSVITIEDINRYKYLYETYANPIEVFKYACDYLTKNICDIDKISDEINDVISKWEKISITKRPVDFGSIPSLVDLRYYILY